MPAISPSWGVALGTALSPTDAAVVPIAKCSSVPHRTTTVLEGESLFNDATSLALLPTAMSTGSAADEHALSPGLLTGKVALVLGTTAAIGWVVDEVGAHMHTHIKEPLVDTTFSSTMPFIVLILAERLGGSGLVATAVADLVVPRCRIAMISATNRCFS